MTEPRPVNPVELARLAKTGCKECGSSGAIVRRQGAGTVRELCRCVGKVVKRRMGFVIYKGALCWALPLAPADARVGL